MRKTEIRRKPRDGKAMLEGIRREPRIGVINETPGGEETWWKEGDPPEPSSLRAKE